LKRFITFSLGSIDKVYYECTAIGVKSLLIDYSAFWVKKIFYIVLFGLDNLIAISFIRKFPKIKCNGEICILFCFANEGSFSNSL